DELREVRRHRRLKGGSQRLIVEAGGVEDDRTPARAVELDEFVPIFHGHLLDDARLLGEHQPAREQGAAGAELPLLGGLRLRSLLEARRPQDEVYLAIADLGGLAPARNGGEALPAKGEGA